MANFLTASAREVDLAQIRRVFRGCTCEGIAGGGYPKIPGWVARLNGEIVGVDVSYPFVGAKEGIAGWNYLALLIVDCVASFAISSLIVDTKETTLIGILINDWARPVGKPRWITMDAGSPAMFGADWDGFGYAYVIQLIHAPRSIPYQNGLAERAARSLRAGIRVILTENGTRPSQKVLAHAVMARTHLPNTVSGIPPELEMTGRSDLLAGPAETAWAHNPDTVGPAVLEPNALSQIPAARTAVMAPDDERALPTFHHSNQPDHSEEFHPIGDTVQIALIGV